MQQFINGAMSYEGRADEQKKEKKNAQPCYSP